MWIYSGQIGITQEDPSFIYTQAPVYQFAFNNNVSVDFKFWRRFWEWIKRKELHKIFFCFLGGGRFLRSLNQGFLGFWCHFPRDWLDGRDHRLGYTTWSLFFWTLLEQRNDQRFVIRVQKVGGFSVRRTIPLLDQSWFQQIPFVLGLFLSPR